MQFPHFFTHELLLFLFCADRIIIPSSLASFTMYSHMKCSPFSAAFDCSIDSATGRQIVTQSGRSNTTQFVENSRVPSSRPFLPSHCDNWNDPLPVCEVSIVCQSDSRSSSSGSHSQQRLTESPIISDSVRVEDQFFNPILRTY